MNSTNAPNEPVRVKADEAIPELDDYDPLFMDDLPVDVMRPGSSVASRRLPGPVRVGGVISIFNVEFKCPEKISFHIKDEQLQWELASLTQHLECYYNSHENLNMRPFNAIPGQFCAVWGSEKWRRGEIMEKVNQHNHVKVNLIDYGKTGKFDLKNVRYLVHQFSTEPRYAFQGCLRPGRYKGTFRSPDAIATFKNDTWKMIMSVGVVDINEDTEFATLNLIAVIPEGEPVAIDDDNELSEESMKKKYFRMFEKSAFRTIARHFGTMQLAPKLTPPKHQNNLAIPRPVAPTLNPFNRAYCARKISPPKTETNPFRIMMNAMNVINNLDNPAEKSVVTSQQIMHPNICIVPIENPAFDASSFKPDCNSVPGFEQYKQRAHFEANLKQVLNQKLLSSAVSDDQSNEFSKADETPEDVQNLAQYSLAKDWSCVKFKI